MDKTLELSSRQSVGVAAGTIYNTVSCDLLTHECQADDGCNQLCIEAHSCLHDKMQACERTAAVARVVVK